MANTQDNFVHLEWGQDVISYSLLADIPGNEWGKNLNEAKQWLMPEIIRQQKPLSAYDKNFIGGDTWDNSEISHENV